MLKDCTPSDLAIEWHVQFEIMDKNSSVFCGPIRGSKNADNLFCCCLFANMSYFILLEVRVIDG